MSHRTLSRSVIFAALLLTVGFTGCGGGGSGSGGANSADLFLHKFLVVDKDLKSIGATGSTDVYRNARLLFVFNAPVDWDSVNERTIRIGVPGTGTLIESAVGRFEQVPGHPEQVVFNPTFSKENVGSTPDNALGFEPSSNYEVHIFSVRDTDRYLRNLDGDGIVQGFAGDFTTTDDYLPEQTQPELVAFSPADGETGVPSRADIIVSFTEPMKPDSFVIGETFLVIDEDTQKIPFGNLRFSADYRTVTFRPVFGYGVGVNDPDPARAGVPISVTITRNVTNLGGRRIPVAISFSFRTEYDPTQPTFEELRETFSTNLYEDRGYGQGPVGGVVYGTVYPLADWNVAPAGLGTLVGTFTSGQASVYWSTTWVSPPPWNVGGVTMQWQAMYFANEVGGAPRTITSFQWPSYTQNSTVTCQNVTIQLGHSQLANLGTNFAANYSELPVLVSGPTTYSAAQSFTSPYWQNGPTFSQNFSYNGVDSLLMEINHTGSSSPGFGPPPANTITIGYGDWFVDNLDSSQPGATPIRQIETQPWVAAGTIGTSQNPFFIRFSYLINYSEAQSKWYNLDLLNPQFLDATVLGLTPVGTSRTLTWQGAPVLALSDPEQADEQDATDWESRLSDVSGHQFVRFHAVLVSNGQSLEVPVIEDIFIPFIFFD